MAQDSQGWSRRGVTVNDVRFPSLPLSSEILVVTAAQLSEQTLPH